MAQLAGALEIQIFAELARLRDDMNKAQGIVKGSMSNIEKSVATAKSALGQLGIGLGVGYFASLIKGTIDAADAMRDLSQRVGINIKELATWELAARQSGATIESIAKGVKGLSVFMLEHSDALRKAGITAKDANGAMIQVADLFKEMPDGVEKTALAVKLFGKAGMEMIPMLNMGSQGLQEAADKAKAYGERLAELAPKADEFNDQVEELALQTKAAGMNIVDYFIPGLIGLATWLNDLEAGGKRTERALEWLSEKSPMGKALVEWNKFANIALALAGAGGNPAGRSSGGKIGDDWAAFDAATAAYVKGYEARKRARDLLDDSSEKKAKEAAAELKLYENALQSLEQQLGALNHQTQYEKTLYQELHGSLQKLTPAHKAHLLEISKQIDAQKFLTDTTNAYIKVLDELDAIEQARIEKARQIIEGMADSNAKIAFENSLIGMSANERELLNIEYERTVKLRGVDSQLQIDGINKQFDELAALVKTRQELNLQLSTWTELSAGAGRFFGALVVNGRSAFDRLRSSLKSFAQEMIALFAQKWILNVAAGALGSTALSASAASVGAGTLAGSLGTAAWSATGGAIMAGYQGASLAAGLAGPTTAAAGGMTGLGAWAAANPYTAAAAVAVIAAKALGIIGNDNGYAANTAYQIYGNVTGTGSSGRSIALSQDAAGHRFGDTMPGLMGNDAAFLTGLQQSIVTAMTSAGKALGVDSTSAISKLNVPVSLTYAYGATAEQINAVYVKAQQDAMTEATKQFAASIGMTVESLNAALGAIASKQQLLDSLKTDTEKLADAQKALSDAGIPATAAGFKAMAEGINPATQAGQELLAKMIALKPAFDLVQQSAVSVTDAVTEVVTTVRSAADILNEQNSLQDQYNQLTMTATELRALERESIDASNLALFDKITTELAAQATAAETKRINDEATAATERLNATNQSWNDQLAILQGTETERSIALRDAGDESTRAIMRLVYAAQDLKTDAEKAAQATAKLAAQADSIAKAAVIALEKVQQEAQTAYDRALSNVSTAESNLLSAYKSEVSVKQSLIATWQQYSATLLTFKKSLLGGALSILSPEAKYAQALANFNDISTRSKLGDQNAIQQLQAISQEFLTVSRDYNASTSQYASDFAMVQEALTLTAAVADRQATIEQGQLDALTQQVSLLVNINDGVITVASAIAALAGARAAESSAASALSRATTAVTIAKTSIAQGSYGTEVRDIIASAKAAGVPGFAVGTNIVPFDMVARVHKGEEIKPASYVEKDRAERAETNTLLRQVILELKADKTQRGAAAMATIDKLSTVADNLDGIKRVANR